MKNKYFWIWGIIGVIIGNLIAHYYSNSTVSKKPNTEVVNPNLNTNLGKAQTTSNQDITKITDENVVANFIHQNKKLPDCYITKNEARNHGWNPSQGNLCDVLPGKAIGGDHFSNREKSLPTGNQYFEADVNFECGHRQTDRLIFDRDGDVWVTHDHYKSFQKK